jgi:hypothetical protein
LSELHIRAAEAVVVTAFALGAALFVTIAAGEDR